MPSITDATGVTELSGSPTESLNESSGSTAERKFLTPMSTRLSFAQAMVGTGYTEFPQCRVVAITMQPWTEDLIPAGVIIDPAVHSLDYGDQPCLLTLTYGPDFTLKAWPTSMAKPTVRAGTELRYQIRGSARFLVVPCSALKWEEDAEVAVPEDNNATIVVPMRSIQLQWDFVDDPPINGFESMLGKVNDAPYLGAPAETLLFESYEVSETFRAAPANPHTNRVIIQLTQRSVQTPAGIVGWNHDYSEELQGWKRMLLVDGSPRYRLASFNGIFI